MEPRSLIRSETSRLSIWSHSITDPDRCRHWEEKEKEEAGPVGTGQAKRAVNTVSEEGRSDKARTGDRGRLTASSGDTDPSGSGP